MVNCIKCNKKISRDDGGPETMALKLTVTIKDETPENIAYQKLQLGKYADSKGECEIALCWECKIDNIIARND